MKFINQEGNKYLHLQLHVNIAHYLKSSENVNLSPIFFTVVVKKKKHRLQLLRSISVLYGMWKIHRSVFALWLILLFFMQRLVLLETYLYFGVCVCAFCSTICL